MNYSVAKQQIHQIIITEIAKYFNKSCTPAGLSLEDLKCLEIIAKMSQFEQDIKFNDIDDKSAENTPVEELLRIVRQSQSNDGRTDPK